MSGLNLKQVNILSDTTHSENEFPIHSARKSNKQSKTNSSNIKGNLKRQSATQKKQVELVEPLADIAETT